VEIPAGGSRRRTTRKKRRYKNRYESRSERERKKERRSGEVDGQEGGKSTDEGWTKTENERAASGKRERRRGMYGDSESCDSTIKLAEFCSWRSIVPLARPPSQALLRAALIPFPFRRSAVIYGLIRLIFPTTPNPGFPPVFLASARTPKTTPPPA